MRRNVSFRRRKYKVEASAGSSAAFLTCWIRRHSAGFPLLFFPNSKFILTVCLRCPFYDNNALWIRVEHRFFTHRRIVDHSEKYTYYLHWDFILFCVYALKISMKKCFTITFCRLASETEISENGWWNIQKIFISNNRAFN